MSSAYRGISPVLLRCLLCVFLFSTGCANTPFEGYEKLDEGRYMDLIYLGDGERFPEKGDRILPELCFRDPEDSTFQYSPSFRGRTPHFRFGTLNSNGMGRLIRELKAGDSATFMIRFRHIRMFRGPLSAHFADTNWVRVDIKLKDIRSPNEWKAYIKEQRQKVKDREMEEQERLRRYLEKVFEEPADHYYNGVYLTHDKRGNGESVEPGVQLVVHYKGFFLDSTCFDNTYKTNEPMDFTLGDPGQMIPGIEIGLAQMRENGKATMIIPSQLAFGKEGSSTGIVPPFTSLRYEVEVVEVKEPAG